MEEHDSNVQKVPEVEVEGVEKSEIYIHVFNGIPRFHTLMVVGYSEKRPLNILIDPGSTHNFINEEVSRQLKLEVLLVKLQSINVGDGGNK